MVGLRRWCHIWWQNICWWGRDTDVSFARHSFICLCKMVVGMVDQDVGIFVSAHLFAGDKVDLRVGELNQASAVWAWK